jgi:AsmA protein
VVGGIAAFIATTDPNDYKDEIVARVRAATGRELTLEGPLEWAFWPKLRLKAGPLALSNAPGFGDAPFLTADEIRVAVATLPLLARRVEMDTVVLHGVEVNLARNADGVTNWQDLAGAGEGGKRGRGGDGLAALILGGVDIRDGRITWTDATVDREVTISGLEVTTGPLSFGQPIEFRMALTAKATQPALDSDVELTGTVQYADGDDHYVIAPLELKSVLRGKQLPGGSAEVTMKAAVDIERDDAIASISGLELEGLGTTVTGELHASRLDQDRPSATGKLNVTGKDIAQIFNAFELPAGRQLAGVADRSFSFVTEFDADMENGNVAVSRLEGRLLGAALSGGLDATAANTDAAKAQGNLKAEGPDLPSLLAVVAQLQGASAANLRNLQKALAGVADKSFAVTATLDADLGAGHVKVPDLAARLLGNTVAGDVLVTNAASDEPAVKGSLTASGPDFPALLAVASGFQADGAGLGQIAKRLAAEKQKAFNIKAAFNSDLAAGRIDVPELSADVVGLAIRGNVKGQGVDLERNTGTLDGRLSVEGEDLGPLLRGIGQADLAQSVRKLRLDAGLAGTPADLSVSPLALVATVVNPKVSKPVELNVSAGAARANLDAETLAIDELRVTGLGLDARAELDAEKILSAPAYSGTLDVPAFNLRALLATLNQPVPQTADPKALTRLGLKTRFAGTRSSIRLDELAVALDDTRIAGHVDVASFEGPDLAFGINIDSLDADRYLEPKPAGKARAATPEAAAAGAASELPVETLRALKVKGKLDIGALVLSGARMKNIKVAIDADGGRIRVDPVGAALYDGSYAGAIVLDATGKQARLDIQTRLNNVRVEPLLKDTVNNDTLSGTVSFNAALAAAGGSEQHIRQTLSGTGTFGTTDGVFRGVDAVAILRSVEQMIECKCPVPPPKGGETRFRTLGGTLQADKGVIRNEDLVLTGDGFNITGKGMLANLHNNTLDYNLVLSVPETRAAAGTATYNLGGYAVPIRCQGSIEDPTCLPDFGGIVAEVAKAAAKKKIEKAVGDKLKDAIGGEAGETLQKLFKF